MLEEIGAGEIPQLLVYNKIDRVEGAAPRHDSANGSADDHTRERVWISARDRLGLDQLRQAVGARLGLRRIRADLDLPPDGGRLRARLYQLEAVRSESHDEHGWRLSLDIAESDAVKLAEHAYGEPLKPLLLVASGTPT